MPMLPSTSQMQWWTAAFGHSGKLAWRANGPWKLRIWHCLSPCKLYKRSSQTLSHQVLCSTSSPSYLVYDIWRFQYPESNILFYLSGELFQTHPDPHWAVLCSICSICVVTWGYELVVAPASNEQKCLLQIGMPEESASRPTWYRKNVKGAGCNDNLGCPNVAPFFQFTY